MIKRKKKMEKLKLIKLNKNLKNGQIKDAIIFYCFVYILVSLNVVAKYCLIKARSKQHRSSSFFFYLNLN